MREKDLLRLARFLSLAVLLHTLVCPFPAWLDDENRPYTPLSRRDLDGYLSDRLPGRKKLLALARDRALLLAQNEFGGAICGKDGCLFSIPQTDQETLQNNLAFLSAYAKRRKTPLCTVLIPNKAEVMTAKLPRFFTCDRLPLWETAAHADVGFLDVRPILRASAGAGKYVYYRGDHHLTALGAYTVYKSLEGPLGYTAAPLTNVQVLDADFAGSEARKMLLRTGDRLAISRFDGDEKVYRLDAVKSDDPYGVLPGYLCGYTRIDLGKGKKMLLFCDSFGCAAAPYLCRHFDIDMVDLRYIDRDTLLRIGEQNYDIILAYFGMDTLAGYELFYKINEKESEYGTT